MADYVWGRFPVLEALRSRRRVHRVMVAQGPRDPALTQIQDQARARWGDRRDGRRGGGWMT